MERNEKELGFMLKVQKAYEASASKGENSIRSVALEFNLSRTKVRKILVTLGVIKSEITDKAKRLKEQGLSIEQIAAEIGVSMATVSTYLPYDTVIYNGEEKSANALNIERYRERLKSASEVQVHHSNNKYQIYEEENKMKERSEKIYRLHLELDIEGADLDTLQKYGKIKKGITRDVLVSSSLTLHALHYVIQRLFGWQNSHLHHYEMPEEEFKRLTDNSFRKWSDYCGIYFRFPSEDMEDIYWDDDYEGDVSIKTWFRRKYSGIYQYHGISEHLMEARYELAKFVKKNHKVPISPSFDQWMGMSEADRNTPQIKSISDMTCDEMDRILESGTNELLERLRLSEIFAENEVEPIPEGFVQCIIQKCKDNYSEFIKLHNEEDDYGYWQKMTEIDGEAHPLTKSLLYQYDYGDGWEVKITLADVYYCDSAWDHPNKAGFFTVGITDEQSYDDRTLLYKTGEIIDDEILAEQIHATVVGLRPVCISADGLPVLDDVGGIGGYCELLKALHGKENGVFDSIEDAEEWASRMGWTGRMNKPEKML